MKRTLKDKLKETAGGKIRSGCQTDEGNGDPPECSVHLPDLSDLPSSGTDQCPSQPDVLLLTVKDCEFLSCYAYLQNPLKRYVHDLGYVYFGVVCDEEHEHVKVALMKCYEGSVGPGCSLTAVKDAVTCLKPKGVISVGYCSGLNREKAKLGDVVVCTKLTTYAPKMVLDTEEQSTGTRTVVSRNFLNLIKNVADGWKAPLKNPETREVEAHAGGEFLSGPERISADWQCAKLLEAYPQADAIELEGEGVFTAAFDLGIEWLLVKGIADFADGTDTKGSWKRFASIMAASVVFHLLSDPNVFKDWPHYKGSSEFQMMKRKPDDLTSGLPLNKRPRVEDAFDSVEMIENIRQLYKAREGTMNLLPWCEDLNFSLGDIYTRLKVIYKDKTRGKATDRAVTMSEIFNPHEECEEPRVVLIEGKPGMGKTTYCKKVVFDWATQNHAAGNYFAKFLMVLLIKCHEVQSSLWEAIDDQLLPRDVSDDQRERFFDFIRHSHSKVLLILDGLDEVSERELPVFSEIIQGRVLPKCRVVVTARHEVGVKVRKYCDTLLEVEGFTDGDARSFINKYFKTRKNLADELSDRLSYDRNLGAMAANPLNCALFCLVWEEFNGAFPESRSQLYMDIVECVLRRYMYRAKKQLPANGEYLVELYESQLNHLGSIALKGLLEDNLDFDEKELGKHKESDLPELGFLSVQPGGSKLRPTRRYGFLHKTFQEFFAALNLASQLIKKEISTDHVAEDVQYRDELNEVLLFTFGILAMRCKETAENLAKNMATQCNQENDDESDGFSIADILQCILECKNDSNFDVELARTLGPCLQIEAIAEFPLDLREAELLLLANVLITNTSVRELSLCNNHIYEAGGAALARCFKENTSLTKLYLNENTIGDTGAAVLAECLKENTSLTVLDLSSNGINDDGAAALAECLKENTSLTELSLSSNIIGYNGAAALAECFKENTSLKDLNLSHNDIYEAGLAALLECLKENTSLQILDLVETVIGNSGAAALAKCLKENTSVTELIVDENLIGEAGAAALAECLKENSSLEFLSLERNDIGDSGAAALAECLKENTSLTRLHLSSNGICEAGAAALADCLKENTSLTDLDLSSNRIREAGAAALADCLKENTSLTKLNLSSNGICEAGAAALAESLKENTYLTWLCLDGVNIGEAGAAALAECLKENSSLKFLHLRRNNIGNSGAAALAKCLKENTSLTNLFLDENSIGEAGAAALTDCLKENTFLTRLHLENNNFGEAGVAALAECLKKNSSLKWLDIKGNNIGKAGAASLAECLKENTSVTVLYRL